MQALTLTRPGHFDFVDAPEPSPPSDGEALVRVRAIGICGTDISGYLGKMPFIEYPRVLGHELAVEVLQTGAGVTHLAAGDLCAVEPYLNCGTCHPCRQGATNCCETLQVLGVHCDGGLCERLTLPARKLHPAAGLTPSQTALVETLAIGCHAVQRSQVQAGDPVLVIGAGPIGLTVMEFALLGDAVVTVIDLSHARREFVRRHYPHVCVIDGPPDEGAFQVVFDATGNARSMSVAPRFARFTGRVVFVGITKEEIILDDPLFHRREQSLIASRNAQAGDFTRIIGLIREGRINTEPWITHESGFQEVPARFPSWAQPDAGVVKPVVWME